MSQVSSTRVTNQSADNYFGLRKNISQLEAAEHRRNSVIEYVLMPGETCRHLYFACLFVLFSNKENSQIKVVSSFTLWFEEDRFSGWDLLSQFCLSLKLMNVTAALIGLNRYEDKAARLGMFGPRTVRKGWLEHDNIWPWRNTSTTDST